MISARRGERAQPGAGPLPGYTGCRKIGARRGLHALGSPHRESEKFGVASRGVRDLLAIRSRTTDRRSKRRGKVGEGISVNLSEKARASLAERLHACGRPCRLGKIGARLGLRTLGSPHRESKKVVVASRGVRALLAIRSGATARRSKRRGKAGEGISVNLSVKARASLAEWPTCYCELGQSSHRWQARLALLQPVVPHGEPRTQLCASLVRITRCLSRCVGLPTGRGRQGRPRVRAS